MVVRGVVCKKNVAHRRMTSKIESPRLLILGGALEYQRVSNALSSFDTLLQQKCLEEHGTAGQDGKKLVKTLMYFEGCPKPLGCTILLRGANGDELKKVKHVLQYGVFAAYHLALETSFLADEGATLPEIPLNTPITVALPGKRSKIERSISTIPGFTVPDSEKTPGPQPGDEPQRSNSVPASELVKVTNASIHGNEYAETSNIPTSMSSQFVEPPASSLNEPSLHASEELGLVGLAMSLEGKGIPADRLAATGDCRLTSDFGNSDFKIRQSDCSDVYAKRNVSKPQPLQLNGKQNFEDQYTLKEDFPPSPADHQSILVSLSSRCVWKGTVCERSHLFRIKYYGNFDKPLGRFLRDHLFDQNYRCRSCEMPAEAHVQCYTHRQGTLTISVKKLPEILLPGERDGKIWMWHRCLKCPRTNGFPPATRRVVMSDAAWGLSFGKFLELSFSNHAAASRVASCGHSLHRDCLRFYGFGKMVACFRYASIDVHSVHLPPPKLDFNHESQEWIEKEFNEVASRAELLFSEVLNALRLLVERNSSSSLLNGGVKVPESRHHLVDLEGMLQKEKSEFEIGRTDKCFLPNYIEYLTGLLQNIRFVQKVFIDVLELNRLRRQLVFQSYMWDHRLIYADSLDNKSQQDDIEVTCSESIQTPKAVTQKLFDINVPVKTGEETSGYIAPDAKPDQSPEHRVSDRSRNHCPEVLHHRTDALFNSDLGNQNSIALKANDESDTMESNVTVPRVLSDGQVPISLSDTLDAAWTGENYPGVGITKNNNLSISVEADNLSTAGTSEKLDVEDNTEDLSVSKVSRSPSFLSSKSENMEDAVSWLGMSFMSFYRSLNKNFLGSSQKLDTLSEYNPVYISSFRESELKGGARLLLPVGVNDTVVPIYDDEPTSIISYALLLPDYLAQLSDEPERSKDTSDSLVSMQSLDAGHFQSFHSLDEMVLESYRSFGSVEDTMLPLTASRSSLSLDPLSYTKALHARVSFTDDGPLGNMKYSVTCYYAKRFEALRRICCPSEIDSLDLLAVVRNGEPKVVTSKNLKGGKESKMDVLVMENLLFGRNPSRLYDLKGSSRSRYNPDSSGSNKVLLDQNLIEAMPTSPIFVGNKAKRLLERAVWNDTAFLASVDVMDYSLLVGVDEEKHELVLGIIDFMRQYTWDKHLETWVKASGILGGPKNASPTVISPKQYKRRFRKAMTTYFLMVPDQWSPPTIVPSNSQADLSEENKKKTQQIKISSEGKPPRGVNTFSPEGRLFQVEYAIEAIKLGSTAIGIKTKEGVVLAVEKRITSPLLEPSSVEKIMEIDEHIGCAMSGLIADARTLVEHARVETQNHRFSYGEPMTVESTTQALCDLALRFGEGDEESMSRPFGVSLLIAGHDENGPSLYYTDPSGTFWQCNAKAIGSGSEGADSSLQEQYNKDLTLKEAETIALSILKQVMEEKVTPNNVDIAKVSPTYHLYTPTEVEAVITRL
ncbi:UNVERIFIED_CONTAM: 1-phosphatidylinositol-3-phosphate 5-kinase FAB1B [Sesamum radiatum]|uniref:1-phosphatidylinositol-3-phosphate 5-kinase FAB1B n=1 Tax=Sesamum radiatum TaxID=300843 RepID=A0AAW2V6Q1_SESRA